VMLFVDGRGCLCQGVTARVAERICAEMRFCLAAETMADPQVAELIVDLINRGCLAPNEID